MMQSCHEGRDSDLSAGPATSGRDEPGRLRYYLAVDGVLENAARRRASTERLSSAVDHALGMEFS